MSFTKEQTQSNEMKSGEEIEKLIEKAIKKVRVNKENDLCKYLPGPSGGYMHHFTLKKLKHANPYQLSSLIQEFIINADKPATLHPKQRAPRGSRKRKDMISFSRLDIEKVLDLARRAGDKDLVSKFSPKRPLTALKRDLIRSIREEKISHDLWNAYTEVVTASNHYSSEVKN